MESAGVGVEQDIDALALDRAADEEELVALARRQGQRGHVRPEKFWIGAERNDLDSFGRYATSDETVADEAAGDPDFVNAAEDRLDPGVGQAAKLPRLHHHPAASGRWLEIRWPLMTYVNFGRTRESNPKPLGQEPPGRW